MYLSSNLQKNQGLLAFIVFSLANLAFAANLIRHLKQSPTRSAVFTADNQVKAACQADEKLELGFNKIKHNDLKLRDLIVNLSGILMNIT